MGVGDVRVLAAAQCVLGEGPVWRPDHADLLFTDIIGRQLLRWSVRDGLTKQPLDGRLGAFARRNKGGVLAIMERGIYVLDEMGQRHGLDFDAAIPETALMNDGKCDRQGRFVFGSKALNETDPIGTMMRFDGSAPVVLRDGFVVFNGPAFSPKGDRIYFADSPSRRIQTAAYDTERGILGAVEVFATLDKDTGYPDGMTVDGEGGLWNAHWDGWRITRYRPDGAIDLQIETPVSRPTSLAFGGGDMRTLFITSAKKGRDDAPPATEPHAGDLLCIDTPFQGLAEPAFAGNGAPLSAYS